MSKTKADFSQEEFLICFLANMLDGVRSVAVGAASPIPVAAALLATYLSDQKTKSMILGSNHLGPFNDGGPELFDRAAQGRIEVFFMSGGQIDGSGNINLVGTGEYPRSKNRFPGSFGTPYLYSLIPRVILFREEHSKRVLVPRVDFVSAAGSGPKGVYRPGGPYALVTSRAYFRYHSDAQKFCLESMHPGNTLTDIEERTGFDFDVSPSLATTPEPTHTALEILRNDVSVQLKSIYPEFTAGLVSRKSVSR